MAKAVNEKKQPGLPSLRVIRASECKQVAWKNGKGVSSEIAISPPGADFSKGSFHWRLSSAALADAEGEFSAFPGFDRGLALLTGQSLTLLHEGGSGDKVIEVGQVHRFSGDLKTSYCLKGAPAQDLNLIFDRAKFKAVFVSIEVGPKPKSLQLSGSTSFFYSVSGKVKLSVYPGEQKATLSPGDTLIVESTPGASEQTLVLMEPSDGKCRLMGGDLSPAR